MLLLPATLGFMNAVYGLCLLYSHLNREIIYGQQNVLEPYNDATEDESMDGLLATMYHAQENTNSQTDQKQQRSTALNSVPDACSLGMDILGSIPSSDVSHLKDYWIRLGKSNIVAGCESFGHILPAYSSLSVVQFKPRYSIKCVGCIDVRE